MELCVVLVVIAVILGIAVVTLLGSRSRAADRAAQARARQALMTQKVHFTNNAGFGDAAALESLEPSLEFNELPTGSAPQVMGEVYVRNDDSETVLASRSSSGMCFWVKQTEGATLYAKAPCGVPEEELIFGTDRW